MPANGLIYAPSHACACFMEAKLYGFWALAAGRELELPDELSGAGRLLEGPAFGEGVGDSISGEWPMHRGGPSRSGSTTAEIAPKLDTRWQTELGGRLTAPVVSGDTLVVAQIDAHRVVALDAKDGKARWTHTAGGRVDSPPTIYGNLVLFGAADGSITCLRLVDGELVWRFQAAPRDLRTVSLDQVESLWPVHGSVLGAGRRGLRGGRPLELSRRRYRPLGTRPGQWGRARLRPPRQRADGRPGCRG